MINTGRKGRPIGFRLSEASKRAISEAKKGQKHKEATKNKISKSLINYFKRKNPLSEEILNTYCRSDDDVLCNWMYEIESDLDISNDILTQRTIRNRLRIEISYGHNIEEVFSHKITPELLLMFKQEAEKIQYKKSEKPDDYEGEIN